jgi:DNA polymerase
MPLWIDFESRSECDLPARGVYNYAQHTSTKVLCMAYAHDDEDVQIWQPGQEFPISVTRAILAGERIYAHNAAFERLIFWYVLCPDFNLTEPHLDQFYCTATQARANCAPGSLEDVGRFAGADMKKDHRGAQLVRKCCIPPFKHTPQDLADLFDYCAQDVRAMRAVSKAMRQLTDEELADYHTNERINDRGVRVDVPLALAAQRYAAVELEEIQRRVVEVTGGAIRSVRSPRMREWVWERLGPEARKLMVQHKDGEEKQSIDKTVRAALLTLAEEHHEDVPDDVAEVIQAADDLWASSAAKFGRMAHLADDEDHRVRGAFVFAGGSATGRASSYGLQAHNFPRMCADDPEAVGQAMAGGGSIAPEFGKRVTDVLKSMLRPALIPSAGKVFVVADWSAIEGRVHPWLSNCAAGEGKLDVFRSKLDPYKVNASATFAVRYEDVTKDQRQIGKVQELALGFLGGPGAFATFGRIYGVHVSEADATRMVNGWRRANPWAMLHGQALESAYTSAMRHPNREFSAGRTIYLYDEQHLWYALPSGRVLCYPFARLEADGVSYAKASWKPAADAKEWPRARLWRGLACENVTQAVANDILRHSLRHLEPHGAVMHVHDEVVVETDRPDDVLALMQEVMATAPAWAQGLPLAIEAQVMSRYGKG